MTPSQRGLLGGALDGYFSWKHSLPPETCTYTVERVSIPVDKDVKLAADLYLCVDTKPLGTILVRSPYGLSVEASLASARIFAARGYQVLLNSCRGTFDSEGELDPAANEAADGQAVVEWMRQQSWYTGSFATIGGSYLAFTQWALLADPPPDMKAAVINTGIHDFGWWMWRTGALQSDILIWSDIMNRLRKGSSRIGLLIDVKLRKEYMAPVCGAVPLLDAVNKFYGGEAPEWLRQTISKPDLADPFWTPRRQADVLEKANIPILLTTGWDDVFLDPVMEDYYALKARGCKVALTVGPWTHEGAGGVNTIKETMAWLESEYADCQEKAREAPVRVFVTGAQEWRDLQEWPPSTSTLELFLGPENQLTWEKTKQAAAKSTFNFDPEQPTPSIGVPLIFDNGTLRNADCSPLAQRSDVLTFDTEVLEQDVEVCGKPTVELHHSTSHPHADVLVVMAELDTTGKSRSITESYIRLDETRKPGMLSLSLSECAHRFKKGSKIRFHVAGGSHPRYVRNLGSGENPATGTTLQVVEHTVQHNVSSVSKLVLPVTTPVGQ
ncbi:hypothetical protein K4F52_006565 [Lecanicillium sp. MT-2017a]|nr:hypothetical protein K4F52_006565 [Lecanicillium sp. MT-2017a]